METVDINEASTHLSRLIDRAVRGHPFIIARAGKPLVVVKGVAPAEHPAAGRFGLLKGQITVPEDFKAIGRDKTASQVHGDD